MFHGDPTIMMLHDEEFEKLSVLNAVAQLTIRASNWRFMLKLS